MRHGCASVSRRVRGLLLQFYAERPPVATPRATFLHFLDRCYPNGLCWGHVGGKQGMLVSRCYRIFSQSVACLAFAGTSAAVEAKDLAPVAGGVEHPSGIYLVQEAGPVQIEITRAAISDAFGLVEVVLRNVTDSPVEIDHVKTVITTDSGEQVSALTPDQAATAFADALNAVDRHKNPMLQADLERHGRRLVGEVRKEALGQLTIESRSFVRGKFYFRPPTSDYKSLKVTFRGIPGEPRVMFAAPGRDAFP